MIYNAYIKGGGDGTVNINKSDSTLIASVTVASGGVEAYNVDDSTVELRDTAGTLISTTEIKATELEVITAPNVGLNINEINEGSFASGSTIDLELTDSYTLVTPDVSVVGQEVTLTLPKPLLLIIPFEADTTSTTFTVVEGSAGAITEIDTTVLTGVTITVNGNLDTSPILLDDGDVVVINYDLTITGGQITFKGVLINPLEILLPYDLGTDFIEITVDSNSVGVINSANTTGLTGVIYEKNTIAVSLPITLAVNDNLIVRYDSAGANGVIKLIGNYA